MRRSKKTVPFKEGDFAEISFTGIVEGDDQPPITAEKAVAEIGGRTTLKEFTDNLLGMKRRTTKRRFTVSYRPDYPEKRLAGKTVEYKVKVEAIKRKEVPEINDEFAQRFGDYKTVDELKRRSAKTLRKHKAEARPGTDAGKAPGVARRQQ